MLSRNRSMKAAVAAIICVVLVFCTIPNSAGRSVFGTIRDNIYVAKVKSLRSTDLSGIAVDEMEIGSDIAGIDLTVYSTDRPNTTGDYDYFLDQVRIGIDKEGKIDALTASSESVSVNGNTGVYGINQITDLLGMSYLDRLQDSEQKLRKRVYYDASARVMAEFVYAEQTNYFAWIVLRIVG